MTADTDLKCLLPGVPCVMYHPYPFQIFQTPTVVRMAFEYGHATRNIYTGKVRRSWLKTTNLNGYVWLDVIGSFVSDQATVVERFTPLGQHPAVDRHRYRSDRVYEALDDGVEPRAQPGAGSRSRNMGIWMRGGESLPDLFYTETNGQH